MQCVLPDNTQDDDCFKNQYSTLCANVQALL